MPPESSGRPSYILPQDPDNPRNGTFVNGVRVLGPAENQPPGFDDNFGGKPMWLLNIQPEPRKSSRASGAPRSLGTIETSHESIEVDYGGPVEEKFPALAGLRRVIASHRLHRTEKALVRANDRERESAVRYIGEAILNGANYQHSEDPNRPTTLTEKATANMLETIYRHRQYAQRRRSNLLESYPDIKDSQQTFSPFYKQYRPYFDENGNYRVDKNLSWGERRNIGKAARHYRRHDRFVRVYDRMFDAIAGRSSRKTEKLEKKRVGLARDVDALEKRSEANKRARQAITEDLQESWVVTKDGVRQAGHKAKTALKTAGQKRRERRKSDDESNE